MCKRPFVLLALLVWCTGGCGDTGTSSRTEKTGPPIAEKTAARPAPPKKRAAIPKPLEAPGAYFKGLSARRLEGALEIDRTSEKPSIVLIVMDALNVRHLGAYGYHRETSPIIDAIADEGVFFTNHVSNSSWTRPSYTTIITGLPKAKHGVELGSRKVESSITTLAERMRTAGYRTAGIVGNPLVREIWGYGQGCQVYRDTEFFDKAFPFDGKLIDEAIEWLKTTGEAPFFLSLFLTSPHVPYRPPRQARKFLKTVPPGTILEYPFREYRKPLKKGDHDRIVAAYDDEIAYMDREIGRLLDYLKGQKKYGKTAFLLTADHGEVFGAHNCYTHTYHMWEPALRVPLIVRAPGLTPRGVYDDRPFTHVDIVPTVLDLAGLETTGDGLDGVSILKVLSGPGNGRERVRFSQYNAHGIRRQTIRDGRYKVIHYHGIEQTALERLNSLHGSIPTADPTDLPTLVASLDGDRYELYDLIRDPGEEINRFSDLEKSPQVQNLIGALAAFLNEKEDRGKMSGELIEALRNAGYFVSEERAEGKGKIEK